MRWLDGITNSMDMSLSKLLGVGDGQGGLVCYSPWGCKESDVTQPLSMSTIHTLRLKTAMNYKKVFKERLVLGNNN